MREPDVRLMKEKMVHPIDIEGLMRDNGIYSESSKLNSDLDVYKRPYDALNKDRNRRRLNKSNVSTLTNKSSISIKSNVYTSLPNIRQLDNN